LPIAGDTDITAATKAASQGAKADAALDEVLNSILPPRYVEFPGVSSKRSCRGCMLGAEV
jgi:hypothetical protein